MPWERPSACLVRFADRPIGKSQGKKSGDAIDIDVVPFLAQWRAFRSGVGGFAVADLEPTLLLIESLYREALHG